MIRTEDTRALMRHGQMYLEVRRGVHLVLGFLPLICLLVRWLGNENVPSER